ncbi:MAG: carbamoyltransferase [Bacteroidales bacterium]|nr:carbamoyltransferase [Bacteroidales bacterium]MCF8387616.1 carbamoyltransferase [Bacteroidales bacterium]MCF8397291.1 carbamoyltransferase [Bacteroidales bacterium]
MPEINLGISAFYHDSAAALVIDGEIMAAAQEERFSRKKHDASFPFHAIEFVMQEAAVKTEDVNNIVFYEKPFIKFERLLETYHAFVPRGLNSFVTAIPVWIKEKLFLKSKLKKDLRKLGFEKPLLYFPEHHLSHAASAYYPSPFEEAAILTLDGVGEWATATIGHGKENKISILREMKFPHSLGLLYSAFTYYTGFRVNSGEYKLMGLAPYGNPAAGRYKEYCRLIREHLVDIREDGSMLLNMDYFSFATGLRMTRDKKWESLFGIPPRNPKENLKGEYTDLALAIQTITEEIILKLARTAREITGSNKLVLSGGVALNSVANGKILQSAMFDDIWIQPAAGDAGGALGAALLPYYLKEGRKCLNPGQRDAMKGAYLGPAFGNNLLESFVKKLDIPHVRMEDTGKLCAFAAKRISEGSVLGWFQGRMEFGPRALGNRSILGDARNPEMQKKLNLKIKYREGFRPFAPSVLEEDIQEYFDLDRASPYMLLVVPVKQDRRNALPEDYYQRELYDRLYFQRSDIPAVTHIDFSARLQSVSRNDNPLYWKLIHAFKELTGYGVLINTSFNVRGEPIVCTPEEAFRCFMQTEMDYLVINDYVFDKSSMTNIRDQYEWKQKFDED